MTFSRTFIASRSDSGSRRRLRRAALLGALTVLVCAPRGGAAGIFQTPVERNGFTRLTSYADIQEFVRDASGRAGWPVDTIAVTRQGRSVVAVRIGGRGGFGADPARLRVLLFAQQHGDEPAGKEALTLLLAHLAEGEDRGLAERLDIIVVPQMNPDGAELGRRRTSDSIDLNRVHLVLSSPEVEGLHRLFNSWMPEVTLDMHEYSSGKEWRDSLLVKAGDVQLGLLTNLNSPAEIRAYQRDSVLPFIARDMKAADFSFHEYIVGSPASRIRHSTTETNDGRQSFGILGTMSFIQEGRQWADPADTLERRTKAQYAAVRSLLRFCAARSAEIRALVVSARARLARLKGTTLVTQMEHVGDGGRMEIPVQKLPDSSPGTWTVHPYHGRVEARDSVKMPAGYVVPGTQVDIISILLRQGVESSRVERETTFTVEVMRIDSLRVLELEEEPHRAVYGASRVMERTLRPGDVIVPIGQVRSLLIATFLEAGSMWGVGKYERFDGLFAGSEYPILRIAGEGGGRR